MSEWVYTLSNFALYHEAEVSENKTKQKSIFGYAVVENQMHFIFQPVLQQKFYICILTMF